MNLLEELKIILVQLDLEKVDYALCGGLAMAVYAFPRSTLDIDIMIHPQDLEKVRFIARNLGFVFEPGLMSFKKGKVQIHRMSKIEKDTEELLVLDLLLVTKETGDVWDARTKMEWDQGKLSVVSPKGLIKLKSMRGSGQDKHDIKFLRSIIDEN